MNARFIFAIVSVVGVLSVLIYSASTSTAKAVVTVAELVEGGEERTAIRLGARLTDREIEYRAVPSRELRFEVYDMGQAGAESGVEGNAPQSVIPVVYYGTMPDTLKSGRDVILEGNYVNGEFVAKSLMTQCPSKYEPPMPGKNKGATEGAYS